MEALPYILLGLLVSEAISWFTSHYKNQISWVATLSRWYDKYYWWLLLSTLGVLAIYYVIIPPEDSLIRWWHPGVIVLYGIVWAIIRMMKRSND